jgi:hypothetical protein
VAEQTGHFEYSGLTNFAAGANLRLRHKFGLGDQAPWFALSGQALYRNYHFDDRDGWQYDAGAVVGLPLSARFSLQGSVRYDAFEADQTQPTVRPGYATDAYDIAGWNFGARLVAVIGPNDVITAGYSYRDGSVTAVTQPDREILELLRRRGRGRGLRHHSQAHRLPLRRRDRHPGARLEPRLRRARRAHRVLHLSPDAQRRRPRPVLRQRVRREPGVQPMRGMRWLWWGCTCLLAPPAHAEALRAAVLDAHGKPLPNAVLVAAREDAPAPVRIEAGRALEVAWGMRLQPQLRPPRVSLPGEAGYR